MSESLTEFIKKYGKPYDPKTDDYDVQSFDVSFDDASKDSKIYYIHTYWTKQSPEIVKQYIEHYTHPGDIVLDAFCGSGIIGVAAQLAKRNAILTDISPACIHISKNYNHLINPYDLDYFYKDLMQKVKDEIEPLYKTKCLKCKNENAIIAYTVFSDVFRCPRCSAEVLYTASGRWAQMKRGEKFSKILCQNCGYEFTKAKAQFVRVEPIEIRMDCPRCKTRGEKKAKPIDKEDWRRYIDIEGGERFINELGNEILEEMKEEEGLEKIPSKDPSYWYPRDVKFPLGYNTRQPLKRGITHPYQMFSKRNLHALSILWHHIHREKNANKITYGEFLFTSIIYNVSLMYTWRVQKQKGKILAGVSGRGGYRRGTLYIPSIIQDVNVYYAAKRASSKIVQGISDIWNKRGKNECQVIIKKKSALQLSEVPNQSIDYLYYDPPYGANINYSELNIMWEAWLGEVTDIKEEVIENPSQGKGREEYGRMMQKCFNEAFRILKPGRWLSLVYSYSDPAVYRLIQQGAERAGFISEEQVLHIGSMSRTPVQRQSDKTQQRFLVINFKKSKDAKKKAMKKSENIDYDVIRVIQDFLAKHSGKTRDYIYDQVIKQLFSTVQIQKFDLDEILKNFFRKVGDEWYAPGTLVTRKKEKEELQGELFPEPPPLEHPEKEVILQLQDFLKRYKRVPYSELREFYLRKIDIPLERNFDDLIKENFKVEEGKVRLPTLVEQERMQDISIQYQIRVIRRFLDGKLDRIPQIEELSNWVEFCYQNEFYKEGAQIFNLLEEDKVEPDRHKKLKKMAEVCRIKCE